ncbi:PAS domain S-box protein [Methanofollis fontis]|uniref:histidine kinase n=1 Tax=Methanofollis fontis TaxID=2052832 RepID=A0A483CZS5_9EURY|nr:PAS domain S-box protein [Methanofollis fontis]TAJ45679.1 histidine kinase [Methanofollis fontis]
MISVLLIDDDPMILDVTSLYLRKGHEFAVTTCLSAHEALDVLSGQSFDAIISDYEMPEMDGIEFLKVIRAGGNNAPFIIFTGRGREDVVIEALNNGANFYLQKGGDPKSQFAELKNMIRQAVQNTRAEAALKISEARYRAVVESQTELISRFLPDGTQVFANEAFCRYYRKDPDEIVGKYFFPDVPQDEKARIRAHFDSLTPENPVGTIEHRVVLDDGVMRWQQWVDRAIFDGNSTLIEYQSVGRDTTDRKLAEEALRDSENKFKVLSEQSPVGIYILRSGRLTYVNPRFAEMFGYTAEEMSDNMPLLHIVHPVDRPFVAEKMRERSEGSGDTYEFRGVRSDGNMITAEVHGSVTTIEGEKVIIGTILDITERKTMEIDLKEKVNYVQALMDAIPAPVFYRDTHGIYHDCNRAFEELVGLAKNEIIGKEIHDFFPREYADIYKEKDGLIIERPHVQRYEFAITDRDGQKIDVLFSKTALMTADGSVAGIVGVIMDISERKKMEIDLKEKVNYVQALMDAIPAPVFYRDTHGIYHDCNRAFEELVGLSREEITGKVIHDFFPREYADIYKEKDGLIIDHPHVQRYEFAITDRDGQKIDVLFSKTALLRADGSVAGIVGVIVDISERKKMEIDLKEKVNYVHALMDAIPAPVFYRDTNGVYHDCNRAFEELVGLSKNKIVGKTIHDFFPREYAEFYKKKDHLIIARPHVQRYEYAITDRNRKRLDVLFSKTALMTADGTVAGILGVISDISERKRMEQALRENEVKYRTLADFTYDWEAWFKPDGKYFYVSPSCERITGFAAAEFMEDPMLMIRIVHPEDRDLVETHYHGGIHEQEGVCHIDYRIITKTGDIKWISHYCQPVFGPDGKYLGRRENKRDITDRKRVEEALKRANEKLNLLSSITRHDVLNRLTSLLGYLEFVRDFGLDSEVITLIEKAEESANVIRHQISFTKDYQDIGVHTPAWQNARHLVANAARMFPRNEAVIENDLNGMEIYADPLLEKVFINLIDNAIRHGDGVSRIRFSPRLEGDHLVILCEDDGHGIEERDKGKIFYRGVGKNTGYGLFLAREILSITGLTIREVGIQGKGACFEITVPFGAYRTDQDDTGVTMR